VDNLNNFDLALLVNGSKIVWHISDGQFFKVGKLGSLKEFKTFSFPVSWLSNF
jgi:hypothetical protein